MVANAPVQPDTTAESRPDILVICFSPLHRDPRVRRQIQALSGRYRVHAAGLTDPCLPGVSFIALQPQKASRFWRAARALLMSLRAYGVMDSWLALPGIRQARRMLEPRARRCKVIIANDIESLPLALSLARHGRVLYDAHEFSPGQHQGTWMWRLLLHPYRNWLCRQFMPQAFRCITVNQPIADIYRSLCGVNCSISLNAPDRYKLQPHRTNPERIRLIHHGGAAPGRQLERMIEMVSLLDKRFTLTLMLMAPDWSPYLGKLKKLAESNERVSFVPPVCLDAIVPTISNYDIGVYILPPNTINHKLSLPNKLFEFIQARLAVAISPNPAMADLVAAHHVGVISEDYTADSLAKTLNRLTADQIDTMRQNSDRAATILNSDVGADHWRTWVAEAMAP